MKTCFFCSQPIQGRAEKHHRIPRRYFRKGQNHRAGNLRWTHHACHLNWHRKYDNPKLSRDGYLRDFEHLALGEGVFNGD